MKRKKSPKEIHEAQMLKCRPYYDKHLHLLDKNKSLEENINILAELAIQVKFDAKNENDQLISNVNQKINKCVGRIISLTECAYIISRACMKKSNTLTEKRMKTMTSKVDNSHFMNSMLTAFYETFCERDELKFSDAKKLGKIKYVPIENEEMKKLIDETAEQIIQSVKPKFKLISEYAKVAYFISNGECTFSNFNDIVTVLYDYMWNGTYLAKIYEKFIKYNSICNKYLPEIENEYNNAFGMKVIYDDAA